MDVHKYFFCILRSFILALLSTCPLTQFYYLQVQVQVQVQVVQEQEEQEEEEGGEEEGEQ